jgi:broad specificity phosphatase PhoE
MKMYFTRHGESEANTLRIISNRELPHQLTEKGRHQAALLAEKLRGKPITLIYTSPILRAKETARILSVTLDIPIEYADALREPDCGLLEGRGDTEAWREHDVWKENWLQGKKLDQGPQDGETCNEVQARLTGFIKNLRARYEETTAEFVMVTHGALILYGLPVIVNEIDNRFIWDHGLGHAVLITTEIQDGKLTCVAWDPK